MRMDEIKNTERGKAEAKEDRESEGKRIEVMGCGALWLGKQSSAENEGRRQV